MLMQHSTGSGKSLTIAGLAYQLARLKLFKVVLVLTDRRVLDRQMTYGVREFLYRNGWSGVHSCTSCEDLTQRLKAASMSEESTVLLSTMQKFRHEVDESHEEHRGGGLLSGASVAVLCDEAHRSYGGVATSNILELLSGSQRIKSSNATFIGFTATPAENTLQMFGNKSMSAGNAIFHPFDTYSMRQALTDGHIMNVLARYKTMEARVELKQIGDKAKSGEKRDFNQLLALHDAVRDHGAVLGSKTEYILKHFTDACSDAEETGLEQPKAMVVCRSRDHVVKYARLLQAGIRQSGGNRQVYASFSGNLPVKSGLDGEETLLTEQRINRGLSLERADIYVVCNKLETGFDEPRLIAMYIDRGTQPYPCFCHVNHRAQSRFNICCLSAGLHGAHAVQVLGRLNRTCPGKRNTSIVDFVNSATTIQHAFEQFWEGTSFSTGPGSAAEIGERALEGYLANILLHLGSLRKVNII